MHSSQQALLGPLLGLAIGDRQWMADEQWELLRETGTVHLLAISGLHIGLAAMLGFVIGQLAVRLTVLLLPYGWVSYPQLRFIPLILSLLFAMFYSFLAGLSVLTQRALIMIVVVHGFMLFYRRANPWFVLSCALCVVAACYPLSIHTAGFCLSFGAVGLLLFSFSGYRHRFFNRMGFEVLNRFFTSIFSLLKAQWCLGVGLFLPSIIFLQGVSFSAAIANLIAVPLVSLITVPLLLLALIENPLSIDISIVAFDYAGESIALLLAVLTLIQQLPLGFWYATVGDISAATLLLSLLGVLWLLAPRGIPLRWLSLFCFLPLFFPLKDNSALRLTFLDVGQGTAIVIETKSHQLVYDTGRNFSEGFNAGEHIIAPYLLRQGYRQIDTLMISHSDNDHVGGHSGLRKLIGIEQTYSGEVQHTGGAQCEAGQNWAWDGVEFSVLWPTEAAIKQSDINKNNASCVLLIHYGEHTVLLAGDIEQSVEEQLLAVLPENISILLVPHHGSRTSSDLPWVNHVQPDYAVMTAGYRNAYGHPHPAVVRRYHQVGATVFNTADDGAIRITVDDNQALLIERWRYQYRRYWYSIFKE